MATKRFYQRPAEPETQFTKRLTPDDLIAISERHGLLLRPGITFAGNRCCAFGAVAFDRGVTDRDLHRAIDIFDNEFGCEYRFGLILGFDGLSSGSVPPETERERHGFEDGRAIAMATYGY